MLNRHLLLQLGDRLRGLRKARGMTTEQLAVAAGITRKTLRSVETGDPFSAIGTYLRVMAVLGVNGVTDRRNGATDVRRIGASNRWVKRASRGGYAGVDFEGFCGAGLVAAAICLGAR